MYIFSEQQTNFKKEIEEIVQQKIEPFIGELVTTKTYPKNILSDLSKLGYQGLVVPDELGGMGLDAVSSMIAINEIAKVDASIAFIMSCYNFIFCYPMLFHATEEQKHKYLIPCAYGKTSGVMAYNEPDGLGDAKAKTTAIKDGDEYIINGTKSMITDAHYADFAIVYAQTDQHKGVEDGYSTFIVNLKNNPGIKIEPEQETMGFDCHRMADINFNNVRVHESDMLGERGKGIFTIGRAMEIMRIAVSSIALGIAERAYNEALHYVKNRKIDGKSMFELQTIQFDLVEMKSKIEYMKLSTFYAAKMLDEKERDLTDKIKLNSIITKCINSEYAKDICDHALQMFGGYGLVRGTIIEQLYRDVRGLTITGGPNEMLKWFLSNSFIKKDLNEKVTI